MSFEIVGVRNHLQQYGIKKNSFLYKREIEIQNVFYFYLLLDTSNE